MEKNKKGIKLKLDDFISAANLDKNWGLTVLSAEQVRMVVKVKTNKGIYALKKVDHKPEKLNFIYEAQEHLWNNGFQNQPRWLVPNSGQPFVHAGDGNFYFLNKWINGTESNIREPSQLKEIMSLQAALHQSSLCFTPSTNAMIKTKWEDLEKDYESCLKKLQTLYNEVKQQPESHLVSVFLETVPGMIKMALVGKELFNAPEYKQVLNRAITERGFIHGDFAYRNIIHSKDGKLNVIDFDYCSQNLRIYDLARFLRKVMRRFNWDIDLNYTILKAYHEVYPLEEDELKILNALMHLPNHYWTIVKRGLVTKYYTPEKTIKSMNKEAAALDKRNRYLHSFPTKL